MSRDIGGFFPLELRKGEVYHSQAIKLNTGRNAFEYLLRVHNIKKIYLPSFACKCLEDKVKELNIKYEFYDLELFTPLINDLELKEGEWLLYINYLGICGNTVKALVNRFNNVIIDNCQAFFDNPLTSSFYSCRKFFGVPDGAYVYVMGLDNWELNWLDIDVSYDFCSHLIERHEFESDLIFSKYRENEDFTQQKPLRLMSDFTQALMRNIDYTDRILRLKNFAYLNKNLKKINKINLDIYPGPMTYPLFIEKGRELSEALEKRKIRRTSFWNHPNLVLLPIDQRYDQDDMEYIANIVKEWIQCQE